MRMKNLRQIHLYLGCIFAPLIIYFAISGAWQTFGFNDLPENETATQLQSFFHELSKPHLHATLPGVDPKVGHSPVFDYLVLLMAISLVLTTGLGLILAFRFSRSPKLLFICVSAGLILPIAFLFLR